MDIYTPRLGSVGERALDYLKRHGRTSLRDLADGIDADVAGMRTNLGLCIRNGLVLVDMFENRTFYSLPKEEEIMLNGDKADADFKKLDISSAKALLASLAIDDPDELPVDIINELSGAAREAIAVVNANGAQIVAEPHVASLTENEAAPVGETKELRHEDGFVDALESNALPSEPKKRRFEFGLFSDGRLVIELAGTVATLNRDETERLFRFANSIEGAFNAAD